MAGGGAGGPDGPADSTNAGTPGAGGSLSGETTRNFVIKRLEKKQVAENKSNTSPATRLTPPPGVPKIRRF